MVTIGLVIAGLLVVGGVLLALAMLAGVWFGTQAVSPDEGAPAPPERPQPPAGGTPA